MLAQGLIPRHFNILVVREASSVMSPTQYMSKPVAELDDYDYVPMYLRPGFEYPYLLVNDPMITFKIGNGVLSYGLHDHEWVELDIQNIPGLQLIYMFWYEIKQQYGVDVAL